MSVGAATDTSEELITTRFARDTMLVTICILLSRMTGFVRVLVAAAVLSNGVLGDTYHAANTIPNILFELFAGGALQAVLVPTFVSARRAGGDEELGKTAGAFVAVIVLGLAAVAVVGVALSPLLARLLTQGETNSVLHDDKLDVMQPMLVVFIPQVIFYGIGMVATAVLAAQRRFLAAAIAPALNNAVVITCLLLYRSTRHGEVASLDLSPLQFAIIAGGTTLAVIIFTSLPSVILGTAKLRWRPRWNPRHPAITALRGSIGWAALSVAGTLVPTAAAIVLGYGAVGGVAVFTMTWAFFVLPHALIAIPVATTLAPRVADAWQRGRALEVRAIIERSAQVVIPLLMLSGAAIAALSWPIARISGGFGQAASQGITPIAHALAMFGLGLSGYGLAFVMTRILFSLGDVKQAAILVTCSAAVGVGSMVLFSQLFPESERAAALALGYGLTQTVSALLLTARVRALTGSPTWRVTGRLAVFALGAAAVAGFAMLLVQSRFGPSRFASLVAVVVAGTAGVVIFVSLVAAATGVRPATVLRLGRGAS